MPLTDLASLAMGGGDEVNRTRHRRRFLHCNPHASPSKSFFAYGTFFSRSKAPTHVCFFTCLAHPRRGLSNAPIGQGPRTSPASAHYTHKKLCFPAHATPKLQILRQIPVIHGKPQQILLPTHRALCIRVGLLLPTVNLPAISASPHSQLSQPTPMKLCLARDELPVIY